MKLSLELAAAKYGVDIPDRPFSCQKRFAEHWPDIEERIESAEFGECGREHRDRLLDAIGNAEPGSGYVGAVKGLAPEERAAGTAWLQTIVDTVRGFWAR